MRNIIALVWSGIFCVVICRHADAVPGSLEEALVEDASQAAMTIKEDGLLRTYELTTTTELRDHQPPDKRITFSEIPDHARIRTGNLMFDGLYALAVHEAMQNSVAQIKDRAAPTGFLFNPF